jgi:hypothetical protein
MALYYDNRASLPVLKGARDLMAKARKVRKTADEIHESATAITDAILQGQIVGLIRGDALPESATAITDAILQGQIVGLIRGDALPPTPTNPTPPTDARNVGGEGGGHKWPSST